MNFDYVHKVWALVWCPRKLKLGVQTLCIALLLCAASPAVRADCPAAPIGDPDDMAISFLAANGVQAASANLIASSVKEGTLVYDDAANKLKVCDGTNWIDVGSGGSMTLAGLSDVSVGSVSAGQILGWSGTTWVPFSFSGAPVMVAANEGIAIGNMIQNGGIAAAFDGNTSQLDTQGAYRTPGLNSWVGKEYPVARNVVQWKAWGSSDYGFHNANANGAGTWELQYKDSSCSADSGWTTADNTSISNNAQIIDRQFTSAGPHLCWRIKLSNVSSGDARTGELQFYVPGASGADTLSGLSCSAGQIAKFNGSAWTCAADGGGGGSSTQVAFSADKGGTNQTVTAATWTPLTWSNDSTGNSYDTNNNFDAGTGRFTPSVAGKYLVTATVYCPGVTECDAAIYKNGSVYHFGVTYGPSSAYSNQTTAIVPMNGSTDYLQAYGYTSGTSIVGHADRTRFSAILISNGGSDTLAGLSCTSGQIPKWNGSAWGCAADGGGAGSSTPYGTWQNVTSSRAFNTTYTNSSTTGLMVSVAYRAGGAGNSVMYCTVGGAMLPYSSINAPNNGYGNEQSFIVPPGATYLCTPGGAAGATMHGWYELTLGSGLGGSGGEGGQDVSFSVHKNGVNQTVATSTYVKLTWATETFDTNNNFDLVAGRFTPTIAGKYLFTLGALCADASSWCEVAIYKNGASVMDVGPQVRAVAQGSILLDMNGSSDYVEAYVFTVGTTIGGAPSHTRFSGYLLSGGGGSIAASSDVALTSVANNDILRYDSASSKWKNVNIGTAMGTTTMEANWPDAIVCTAGSSPYILYSVATVGAVKYYRLIQSPSGADLYVAFNSTTQAHSTTAGLSATDCVANAWSISQLYAQGKAFNFIGSSLASAASPVGGVQFNNGSGVLAADAGLTWDNTNKRLGIGSTSPAQKLSVAGTIESTSGGFKFPDGSTQTTSATGLSCNTVTQAFGAASTATATCGAGYTMTGGGFQCGCGNGCMAASSYPNGNGWTAGYCFYYGGTAYGGTTYARCCQ